MEQASAAAESNNSVLEKVQEIQRSLNGQIVGQTQLVERLLITLLAGGHLLVEGAPGLAKTTAVKAMASQVEGDFHRIQFTPDLLPADLTGTEIYRPQDGTFSFQKGPLFHHVQLADEINRAPAKVQSALLEAMGEGQITVGGTTYKLPQLFMVMATQNPIEQEGTYPLPEAQLDRFLMHVNVGYPDRPAEKAILEIAREQARQSLHPNPSETTALTQEKLFQARDEVLSMHLSDAMEDYIVEIVLATREPGRYDQGKANWVDFGASPRGSIALDRCARAHAWLTGKDFVGPDDVHAVAKDVLRHRVLLRYEAQADGASVDQLVDGLIAAIPLP